MIRFLKALILLPVAIIVVLLAVANRAPVTLSLDPFSQEAPEFSAQIPLFLVIFAAVMVGVVIGGVATWLAQSKNRRKRRHLRREANTLRHETERLRAQQQANATLPALPSTQASRI
ncbi:lipopolysaccharide assembly protein LapA domain-containing protein [Microvirga roseola]|uniref:lipopolysaccharide assembly protein LapA domain-containing protein n=1 Tax=Microvirga roseola TaxID=2883126 RepID=UPI001E5ED54B|nr:lipopolysaccharide assembly protein LapA domain-containing protein [Microvirga roseola]